MLRRTWSWVSLGRGLDARLAAALLCATAACAGARGEGGPSLPPGVSPIFQQASARAPEAAGILAALYGPSFDAAALKARVEAALVATPTDPDLHEAAAYLALLRGDQDTNELHSLLASLDARAAAPLVYLKGSNPDHPLVVQVAQVLARSSPDPELRATAHTLLLAAARQQLDDSAAQRELSALGVLDRWQILGAFDNDEGKGFLTQYPPEQKLDFGATYPGVLVPIRWRPVSALGRFGEIPFDGLFWPTRHVVGYAATVLRVPQPTEAVLWLWAGMPVRIFVDGQLALSHETLAGGGPDNLALRLHLGAGAHTLLIKSANKNGPWSVRARLQTPDGGPVPGLSVSTALPASGEPTPQVSFEELPVVHGLAVDPATPRGHFLAARMALRQGDPKLAVREATAFEETARDNPLALWDLAGAARANDEQGKQLDLLNEGVKRFGQTLPSFYFQRARVYVEKNLFEKAQTDAESFLRLRPKDLEGSLLLAQIQGRRSFGVERCATLASAVADHPRQVQPLRELAGCQLDRGHLPETWQLLREARRLAPGDDETLYTLFDLSRRLNLLSQARALNDIRRSQNPSWAALWIDAGDLAERAEDAAAAQRFYTQAQLLSPDHPAPLIRLAELAYRRGEITEAIRLWSEASQRDPGNGQLSERLEHLNPTRLGFIEKFVPSDETIDAAVAAGQKRVAQDGSQVVFLLDDEVTDVHADGSSTRVVTTVEKAVNDQGRDALTQASVPTQGRVKLLKAYAVSKDGERQEASSVRNGVFRFRKLQVGSTVVLQYIHYAPAAHFLPNEFISDWSFESAAREHVLSHWTLVLPKDRVLHVWINGDVKHAEREEDGFKVYQFEAREVPPFVEEPSSLPLHDLLRHVSVSTVPSWDDYARWERALLADAFQESNDLGDLAKKLTAGAKTPREKLDRLTAYVAEQIRYQTDYENTIAGVRPHSSRQVLERGYADCKDKAVLLISLAKEIGLKLDFVDVRTHGVGSTERDIPNQQFNHAIVYVPKQDAFPEPFFVDATTDGLDVGSLREDDQGTLSLVLDPRQKDGYQFVAIPFRPASEQYDKSAIHITVQSDGKVSATDRMELRGSMGSVVRRLLKNPAYARKFDEQLAAYLFPGSSLTGAEAGDPGNVWTPITLNLTVDDGNALDVSGQSRRLRLPSQLGLERLTSLVERRTPLWLGIPETNEWHLTIDLPAGSQVTELPEDFTEQAQCLSLQRVSTQQGAQIDVALKLVRTCSQISPAEYPAFRGHLLKVMNRMEQRLAFATKASKVKLVKNGR